MKGQDPIGMGGRKSMLDFLFLTCWVTVVHYALQCDTKKCQCKIKWAFRLNINETLTK